MASRGAAAATDFDENAFLQMIGVQAGRQHLANFLEMNDAVRPLLSVQPSSLNIQNSDDLHGLFITAPADRTLIIEPGTWLTWYAGILTTRAGSDFTLHQQRRIYSASSGLRAVNNLPPGDFSIRQQPTGNCHPGGAFKVVGTDNPESVGLGAFANHSDDPNCMPLFISCS